MRHKFLRLFVFILFLLATSLALTQHSTASASSPTAFYQTYADIAANQLNGYYNTTTGLWADWWTSANELTTMIDYMMWGGSYDYSSIINNTYTKNLSAQGGNFTNTYMDDTGWWGLAWIRAYDKTGNTAYLNTAQVDADYINGYWDSTCGGGVWWNTSKGYKNAITNELYIKLNAAYYNRTGNTTYLTRAQNGWNWFINSGMINSSNLINDGLTTSCTNNAGAVWTYNQGVILGAAAELHRATNNTSYLTKAQQIANAALTNLIHTGTGALRENACESNGDCGHDGQTFKGVFMRNLYELNARQPSTTYQNFMTLNADVIWANDRNGDQFGVYYSGPVSTQDDVTQNSALDAFVDAIQYASSGNLAVNKATSASGSCGTGEESSKAVDNSLATKWCSGIVGGTAWQQTDSGANNTYSVLGFTVFHAGAGGESATFNTRDFLIQGSSDATTWFTEATIAANTANFTFNTISAVGFRYYRLWITNPQTDPNFIAARIYEFQILGYRNSTPTNTPTFVPPTNTTIPPTATTIPPTKTNTPVPGNLFSTSLESGQTQPTWSNTVEPTNGGLANVGGICCGLTGPELGVRAELGHTGTSALMYSGMDNSATSSYAYMEVFNVGTGTLSSTSKLSYWIYPQSSATSNLVSGNNSSCVAIDIVFTDNTNLRDSGVTDQNGDRVHPAMQCGHLTMNAWNNVTANLGSLSGKTLARINVAYDQPTNTGGYRGYVDDISISR